MKVSEQFMEALKENSIHYNHQNMEENGKETGTEFVTITGGAKNFSGLTVHWIFKRDDDSVNVRCFEICRFSEEKNLIMLQTVNSLNYTYRWVTFSISPERKVTAEMSVAFTDESAKEILMGSLHRFYAIVDEAYPVLMRALYAS